MRTDKNNAKYAYFPHEARIRNLTYQVDSQVEVHIEKKSRVGNTPQETLVSYPKRRIELCKIPVMIRSKQCYLSGRKDSTIMKNKECMYDQGGYFVINGSEKVIVAQERQACNIVLVFNNKLPNSKYSWNA